ncbi:MipA/OmpV family protein [Bradyrhizobium sp. UFLA05-153]
MNPTTIETHVASHSDPPSSSESKLRKHVQLAQRNLVPAIHRLRGSRIALHGVRAINATGFVDMDPASAAAGGTVSSDASRLVDGDDRYWGNFKPAFEGATRGMLGPIPIVNVQRAGSRQQFISPRDSSGIALFDYGAFRAGPVGTLLPSRKAGSDAALNGLYDVRTTIELGRFIEYSGRLVPHARRGSSWFWRKRRRLC